MSPENELYYNSRGIINLGHAVCGSYLYNLLKATRYYVAYLFLNYK